MGRKLDALLRRNFKASKFRPLLSLALSRLAILTNQRHVKRSQARSDALQLLQSGHHHRALLRVEQAIKEQNVLDAYVLIEGYLNLLIERADLLEQGRECPEELIEAVSGLLFAASRWGDFPELQQIKSVLTTRFGKEFTARAVELRNNCGVSHSIMQKLSTRQPNLESRMNLLEAIASENNIVLKLDEPPVSNEEKLAPNRRQNYQQDPKAEAGENLQSSADVPSGSMQAKQKYKDVADAAQAAFESAAQAAAAARAAMELSRSESQDPDDPSTPKPGSGSPNKSQEQKKSSWVESKPKQEIDYQNQREEEEAGSKNTAEVKNSMAAALSSGREKSEMEEQRAQKHETGMEVETGTKPEPAEETGKVSFGLNLEKKPMSVRTRRVRGF